MNYMKIEFTGGFEGEGFMEIEAGKVLRLTDLDGETLVDLTKEDEDLPVFEYHITDKNPTMEWANV